MAQLQFSLEMIRHHKHMVDMIVGWFKREYKAEVRELSRGVYDAACYELITDKLEKKIICPVLEEVIPGVISITHD